ncbi:MAG TPA: maleylpyruvate isomerase family mycothiol-dependent enzyme [Candidatus Stackebrandtia excrementipullorum]|nr:maleylpyruvate isomerase family mycothiol-dependent enzyme [Candidatus Stackebrandtia excrementipullorum]
MDKAGYTAGWQREFELFWSAVVSADLDTPVPSCPDWTLNDLIVHMDTVARRYVRRICSPEPPAPEARSTTKNVADPRPALAESAASLTTSLSTAEFDDTAWNWAPMADTAWFWFRRAACETAVHRWDAQMAVAGAEPVAAELATEGIDEVLDSFLPAGRRMSESDASGLVHLLATDVDREWFVRRDGRRYTLVSGDDQDLPGQPVHARAAGPASDVYLALWGRVPFSVVDCEGDPELLEALRAK